MGLVMTDLSQSSSGRGSIDPPGKPSKPAGSEGGARHRLPKVRLPRAPHAGCIGALLGGQCFTRAALKTESLLAQSHTSSLQLRATGQSRLKTEGTRAAFLYKTGAGKLVTASQTETSKLLIPFTNSQVLKSTLFVKTC